MKFQINNCKIFWDIMQKQVADRQTDWLLAVIIDQTAGIPTTARNLATLHTARQSDSSIIKYTRLMYRKQPHKSDVYGMLNILPIFHTTKLASNDRSHGIKPPTFHFGEISWRCWWHGTTVMWQQQVWPRLLMSHYHCASAALWSPSISVATIIYKLLASA